MAKNPDAPKAGPKEKHAILVLGMHRSGTSACARIANLLGAHLPEAVVAPNKFNPKGYWEAAEVVDFNDSMLAQAGYGWDDPVSVSRIDHDLETKFGAKATHLVQSIYGDADLILVKDPRCTLLPEFWISALERAGYSVCILLAHRSAHDVAYSLGARDGISPDHAGLLWARYNVNALRAASNRSHIVVPYSDLPAEWQPSFDGLARSAGFKWPVSISSVEAKVEAFLGETKSYSMPEYLPPIEKLIDEVRDLVFKGAALKGLRSKLTNIDARIDAEASVLLDYALRQRRVVQARIDELTEEREQARADQIAAAERADAAQLVIEQAETERDAARMDQAEAVDRAEAERDIARRDQSEAEDRAKAAQVVIEKIQAERDEARTDQAAAEERAASARAVIEKTEAERDAARAAHASERQEKDSLLRSVHQVREENLRYSDEFASLEADYASIVDVEEALRQDFRALHGDFVELERSVAAYSEHAERLEADLKSTQSDYGRLSEEKAVISAERAALRMEREVLQTRLSAIENSTSWKITRPLREFLQRAPGLASRLRQGAKLVWWTVTLQLFARLQERKRQTVLRLQAEALPNQADKGGGCAEAESDRLDDEPTASDGLPPFDNLAAFLSTAFDEGISGRYEALIRKYQLPFQREDQPPIKREVGAEEARAWAQSLSAMAGKKIAQPDISIVLPVYNQIAFTLACIESLLGLECRYTFEVLVGDDRSSDGTQAASEVDIANVRWIRHPENLGFVRNCNRTAEGARGKYVVFLNNDTLVLPGWLDALIDTLEENEDIGLTGSKLIYPDGRLQEAGGIFWQDGSAWNLGRFEDPRRPEYSYSRDVDYISGASIALPTALWCKLNGFDELFVPAYAEDADLAFRVRDAGYRTVFQPASQLIHFEGVTSGTDLSGGAKAHQVTNLQRFKKRWEDTLKSHRPNAVEPQFEKERSVEKRALFVDLTSPEPQHDAGSVVAIECMRALQANGYKVTFVPQDNFLWTQEYSAPLQRAGIEVIYHPYFSRFGPFIEARGREFDLVFIHRFQTAERILADVRAHAPQAKVSMLNADLHYLREQREAELQGDDQKRAAADLTKRRELAVMKAVDLVLTHSTVEQGILEGDESLPTLHLPLIHDPEPMPSGFDERRGVGFIGGYGHPPNADAVDWFLDEIWPLVRADIPEAEFVLAGSKMPARFKRLDGRNGVRVLGFVEKLEDYFDSIRVNIAPLRFGAGAKGKVAASLAHGVPCVATDIAAEGMGMVPDQDVLIANAAEDMARKIVLAYSDSKVWNDLRAGGLVFAKEKTSRVLVKARIAEMADRLQIAGRVARKAG